MLMAWLVCSLTRKGVGMRLSPMNKFLKFHAFLDRFLRVELKLSPEHFQGGSMETLEVESRSEILDFMRRDLRYCYRFYIDSEGSVLAYRTFAGARRSVSNDIRPPLNRELAEDWLERVAYIAFQYPGSSEGEGEDQFLRIFEVRLPAPR